MRTLSWTLALAIVCAGTSGCGPKQNPGTDDTTSDPTGDGGMDPTTPEMGRAAISGRVWAPGQAPGMVPAGQEIPVYNALVSVATSRPAPIPQETYCERCVDPTGIFTFTDHDGSFALQNLAPGTYWLVIEKGQFRLEQQVTLSEDQNLELMAEESVLPSRHDPDSGQWIPRIAIAVGRYDYLEDILGKMGLGSVDSTGRFEPTSASGIMDIYDNGAFFNGPTVGTLQELVGDLDRMLRYHIIFIPCSDDTYTGALYNQDNLRNIRQYVEKGGKLYVTDWSGEWSDNVFPAQVTLGPNEDTPAEAYDPAAGSWDSNLFGNADGADYDSENAEIIDDDLATWLDSQQGPIVEDYNTTVDYDPSLFTAEGNWNYIQSLNDVETGTDDQGMPIIDMPRAYIIGGQGTNPTKRPLTVTFEPAGCGRVLYSTYHTTDATHRGLVPQERVLLYLIMEIGICQSGPVVE